MSVSFDYWGQHEIFLRLSQEKHRGRAFFWFEQEVFSDHWFRECLEEAVSGAGARYTPTLNVNLPIAHLFDGLGRTNAFFECFHKQVIKVKEAYQSIPKQTSPFNDYSALEHSMQKIMMNTTIDPRNMARIAWEHVQQAVSDTSTEVSRCIEVLEQQRREQKVAHREKEQQQDAQLQYELYDLRELKKALRSLGEIAQGDEARLANVAALLVVGDAGKGKTHLFCDVAEQRLKQRLPTILLLGEQFHKGEPWSQMKSILGLSRERNEFLGALSAAAEARGQRALILIDALNEREGISFWKDFLASMLAVLSRYRWIGVALSVRSSYENLIVPHDLVPDKLVRATHAGFTGQEYEATKAFFDYYGIERPSVPLLVPEFQNPLFLKLFCQGLHDRKQTRIPEGLQGITSIFRFFLDNLNKKLTERIELDLDPSVHYILEALDGLIRVFAERKTSWIPRNEAKDLVNHVLPNRGYENSLFRQLIVEGVLAEDNFLLPGENGEADRYEVGVRFSYERLSDHLIVKYLLDRHLDPDHPQKMFEQGQPLGELVSTQQALWWSRGLIEALSIQLPERVSKELCALVPSYADDQVIREAFVESLLWRNPASINDATLQLLNASALRYCPWTKLLTSESPF